ncbi:tail fiber domain-containing protein [Variovorax paradoxus]|nr:tail fiber domain-containing protein [Variovorax paradoxus]
MAHVTGDRILELTTSTGQGDLTLAGAVAYYRPFSDVAANGDTVHYLISDVDAVGRQNGGWELGRGTVQSGALQRTTVVASSNAGAKVDFGSGNKNVSLTVLAPTTSAVRGDWRGMIGALAKGGDDLTGALNYAAEVDVASATTVDLAAVASNNVRITGTTPVTALGTLPAGARRRIRFAGILQLTHNATSLIMLGGGSITTAANDVADFLSLGGGNWRMTSFTREATEMVVKEPAIAAGTAAQYWRGDKTWQTLNKAAVALSNVDNTSDAAKPVSTATQTALNAKATLNGSANFSYVGVTGHIDVNDYAYIAYYVQANYGLRWNAGAANALNPIGYQVSGQYRYVPIGDFGSHGDVSTYAAYHQPAVESFVQFNIGGSGNYFRFGNDGVGRSNGGWTTHSDRRVKEDIEPIVDALAKLAQLTGCTFVRPDMKPYDGPAPRRAGLIAQQLLRVLPEAITVPRDYDVEADTGGLLSVEALGVVSLLVAGINELRAEVRALKDAQ